MDGRRELQTLAAGVFAAFVDGVICGVGRHRRRTRSGVGGRTSVFGSKKRGRIVDGVGVLSCEIEPKLNGSLDSLLGLGVASGEGIPNKGMLAGASVFSVSLGIGIVSNSGVSSGTTSLQVMVFELRYASGVCGRGV